MRTVAKVFCTFFCVGIALCLLWYGLCLNRIAALDLAFINRHWNLFTPFATAWVLRGNQAYYEDLDPYAAEMCYRNALARQPLMIGVWLNLAKVQVALGKTDESRRILEDVSQSTSRVSTWKWQECLLAYELRDEELFSAYFNFVLERLPNRVPEAVYLARSFWGGWAEVLPHLGEGSREAFLGELMKAGEVQVGLDLWKTMEESENPPKRDLQLRFSQFLLANGAVSPAKKVWAAWRDDNQATVYDGGFEKPLTNAAFGWRVSRSGDVTVERTKREALEGKYCMHIRFHGIKNVNFAGLSQVVPVSPGKTYRLELAQKSVNLTTDQGVFVEVTGYGCKRLHAKTAALTETVPWTREQLEFRVPDDCEAVQLTVRRQESIMLDSKIAGDYWLDAVELIEIERLQR